MTVPELPEWQKEYKTTLLEAANHSLSTPSFTVAVSVGGFPVGLRMVEVET